MGRVLRVGIVGFGKMGILHAGILNALGESKVVAVTEREALVRRYAGKVIPSLAFYPRVKNMLVNEDLDAIYVTSPIVSHRTIMEEITASGARVAVFVEKPLANTVEDAELMLEQAENCNIMTMLGFQKRFSPIFKEAKRLLLAEVLGNVASFQAHSFVTNSIAQGSGWRFKHGQGGALLDLGPHVLDLLIWYFSEPTSVTGNTWSVQSAQVDDAARCSFEFGHGISGTVDISWSVAGYRLPEMGVEVVGDNGKLRVTDDSLTLTLNSSSSGISAGVHKFRKPDFDTNVEFMIGDPEYCFEDEYFMRCILEGVAAKPNFGDGVAVNRLIEKIRKKN